MSIIPGANPTRLHVSLQGEPGKESVLLNTLSVDKDYLQTLEIEFIAGSDFGDYYGLNADSLNADSLNHESAYIINKNAASRLGGVNVPGRQLDVPCFHQTGIIIGVMEDFNFLSLHNAVEPEFFAYIAFLVSTVVANEVK